MFLSCLHDTIISLPFIYTVKGCFISPITKLTGFLLPFKIHSIYGILGCYIPIKSPLPITRLYAAIMTNTQTV